MSEDIIKGNKLIAEFVKLERRGQTYYYEDDTCDNNKLLYHTSWDWLMPVVEKIEKTWINGANSTLLTEGDIVQIYHGREHDSKDFATGILRGERKKTLWLAVIEFINWYNKQSK